MYIYKVEFCCFFFLNLDILVLSICIGIISIVFIHTAHKKSTSQKCLQNKTPMRRDPSSLNGGLYCGVMRQRLAHLQLPWQKVKL